MPLVKAQGALLLMIAAADAFKASNGASGMGEIEDRQEGALACVTPFTPTTKDN